MRYLAGAVVIAVVVVGAVVVGVRGNDGVPRDAVLVADRFMDALVVQHEPPHISLSIGVVQDDMYAWTTFLEREGVNTIVRGGVVEEDCQVPFPIFVPEKRMTADCVVYEVRGRIRAVPHGPAVMTAKMRVWLIERRGAWRVAELDFTPRNGFRSTSKAFHVEGY